MNNNEIKCPYCDASLPISEAIDGSGKKPSNQAVSVCIFCGGIVEFCAGGTKLAKISEKVLQELKQQPDYPVVYHMHRLASLAKEIVPDKYQREKLVQLLMEMGKDAPTLIENFGKLLSSSAAEVFYAKAQQQFACEIDTTSLQSLAENNHIVNIVFMAGRPMSSAFSFGLEHRYFHPDNEKLQELFQISMKYWQNTPWIIISIPVEFKLQAMEVAEEVGLKLTQGSPLVISPAGSEHFPLSGNNVFCIETDPNGCLTKQNLNDSDLVYKMERTACKGYFEENKYKYTSIENPVFEELYKDD